MKQIFAISGSTKEHSANKKILKYIAEFYNDRLTIEIYEGVDKLPHFNPELDNENPPAEVEEFREKIQIADGVLFCTPEYVFSLPGSLKNAIEWTVSTTVFSNKSVALIVASASGEKAFKSLQLVLTTIEARIADQAKVLIQGAKGKVGENGMIRDQSTREEINSLVESFIKSIEEEDAMPTKYSQD